MTEFKYVTVSFRGTTKAGAVKVQSINKSGDVRIDNEEIKFMIIVAQGQIIIDGISDGNIVLSPMEKKGYYEIKAPVSYWDKVRRFKKLIRKSEIEYAMRYTDRDLWKDNRTVTLSAKPKVKTAPIEPTKTTTKRTTKKKTTAVNPDSEDF